MTVHNTPLRKLQTVIDNAQRDDDQLVNAQRNKRFKRLIPSAIRDPEAYQRAVEFNKRHGIGPKANGPKAKTPLAWKLAHLSSTKPVTLPSISCIGRTMTKKDRARKDREDVEAEAAEVVRAAVNALEMIMAQLINVPAPRTYASSVNQLQLWNAIIQLKQQCGVRFAEDGIVTRKVNLDDGTLKTNAKRIPLEGDIE